MNITKQQKVKIDKLEEWYRVEVARLRVRRLDIMKRYDFKKSALLKQQLIKKIKEF